MARLSSVFVFDFDIDRRAVVILTERRSTFSYEIVKLYFLIFANVYTLILTATSEGQKPGLLENKSL